MVIVTVVAGALLLFVTVLQSSFADHKLVKKIAFKTIAVTLAAVSAGLMIWTAVKEKNAKDELDATLKGISKTVFPKDINFSFSCEYNPLDVEVSVNNFIDISVFIISRDSPFFGRWGVTHTPNVTLGVGMFMDRLRAPTHEEFLQLFVAKDAELLLFKQAAPIGSKVILINETISLPEFTFKKSKAYPTLDDYLESQFLCTISGPGRIGRILVAELIVKGKRVPFHMLPMGTSWIGVTVFRPTYERYIRESPSAK